jgi:formate dehydrogenase subunit delta
MSDRERLARMAGQIAAAFGALPEEQAVAAIAAHINQFWAPPMRRDLLALDPALLAPRVRQARALVRPPRPGREAG